MNREDVRKLLGGYATGTLTAAEREALFSAALEDQELFNALMKEEPLRELLDDPATKNALIAAMDQPPARPAWWRWRPLLGAVAMAGIVLATVAIWRGTRETPAPVIVADLSKQPERVPPPVPPQPQVKPEPQIKPQTAVIERAAPAKRKLQEGTKVELQSAIRAVPPEVRETPPSALANMPAASPAAAPPPPPQQQQGALTPSPKAQQQLSDNTSVSAGAASELNRAAAVSGFRAASPTKEMAADKSLDKKAGPVLQWSILRADRDLPPATLLDPDDTIRLRIVPPETGTLTLTEGDKQLASASVEASQAFDTPPIPYTIAGPRHLRVTLTTGAAPPFTFLITLNYR